MKKLVTVSKKPVTYQITTSYQAEYDPYDLTRPGYYAWVGPPGDQSEFCFGPRDTEKEAMGAALKYLGRFGEVKTRRAR